MFTGSHKNLTFSGDDLSTGEGLAIFSIPRNFLETFLSEGYQFQNTDSMFTPHLQVAGGASVPATFFDNAGVSPSDYKMSLQCLPDYTSDCKNVKL